MTWIEVVNVVKEVGVSVVILAAVIYLLVKYFSAIIDNKIAKNGEKVEEKLKAGAQGLQYNSVTSLKILHPIFNKIDNIVNVKLLITKIGGPVRTKIFRDVLTIYYRTAQQEISNLLDKDVTLDNFLSYNYNMINTTIKNSNDKMRAANIPEVVIEKFNTWNSSKYDYMLRTISDIDSSDVFSTTVEKQYAALNLYTDTGYFMLMDAEKTLKNLNGDLTGTIYKGEMVEGLHEQEELL